MQDGLNKHKNLFSIIKSKINFDQCMPDGFSRMINQINVILDN